MSGSWTTFNIPNTSTGAFSADLMILLTDGSVLCHNGYASLGLGPANQWLRLTPDQNGKYETGSWSAEIDMQFARQWFGSGVLMDGRVFVIGGEDCSDPLNPTDAPPARSSIRKRISSVPSTNPRVSITSAAIATAPSLKTAASC